MIKGSLPIFITGNPGKVKQLAFYLDMSISHHELDLPEIQSLNLEEIVRDKAQRAYDILKVPVLVEDVSLTFTALGKLPGPLIKWFLGELGTEGLSRLVDGKERTVVATVLYGLYDGETCHLFEGSMTGTVAASPREELSFGWSPVFVPDGSDKTWAEMTMEEQAGTNMRRIALDKVGVFLGQD